MSLILILKKTIGEGEILMIYQAHRYVYFGHFIDKTLMPYLTKGFFTSKGASTPEQILCVRRILVSPHTRSPKMEY